MKTVAFTGHREFDNVDWVDGQLRDAIRRAINKGYTEFITGLASGVDQIAHAIVVKERSTTRLRLRLVGVRPFETHGQNKTGSALSPYYVKLLQECDDVVVVSPGAYTKEKYWLRDKWMVDQADVVIAVYDGRPEGGTKITYEYALQQGLPIYLINPKTKVSKWMNLK